MIQYRVVTAVTSDDIEKKVEAALNNDRENWKLHGGLVVLPSKHPNSLPFMYFQAVVQEVTTQRM